MVDLSADELHKRPVFNEPTPAASSSTSRLQEGIALLDRIAMPLAMLIGYARVSTDDRDTAAQAAALKVAGCERIFREKASGGRWDRPQLQRLLDKLREADGGVVWKLDRPSRSFRDVLMFMEQLKEAGAGFRSLTEAIDTTTTAGRMMMQMVGAFAEFERAMLPERKAESAVDAPSPHYSSKASFSRWFPKAARGSRTPRGCSRFIRQLPHDCWRVRPARCRGSPSAPNNLDGSLPLNPERDTFAIWGGFGLDVHRGNGRATGAGWN